MRIWGDFTNNSQSEAYTRCNIQETKKNLFIRDFEFFLDSLEIVAIALNRYGRLNYIISWIS